MQALLKTGGGKKPRPKCFDRFLNSRGVSRQILSRTMMKSYGMPTVMIIGGTLVERT